LGGGRYYMLDKDSKAAANRFIEKLKGKGFVMSRSQNKSEDYDLQKQKRDSEAVDEFTKSQFFQDVMKMR